MSAESRSESRQQEVNVRVAIRLRPLLPKEKLAGEQCCVRLIPDSNQLVIGKDRGFTFDYVLGPNSIQDDVYQSCVEPLVKSTFEGYNGTVFAYGQTGSGKTYTIGGSSVASLTEDEFGIIPRALKQMFAIMQSNENVSYTVTVSYIEIYKEELRDLLDIDTSPKDLHVREDNHGNTVIIGAQELQCESLDEILSLLESGSAARHTGATQMNEYSSRSHSVFTVVINQKWSDTDISQQSVREIDTSEAADGEIHHCMSGKFHFVDLAGSERAHRTGNVGDRFKESVYINTGLLALGNVISALGDPKKKSTHIPYRDAKITRLLKDSLGGNAKTLMICCVSPAASSFDETLNSLKYANRARNIKNKPVVNRDVQSIRFEEMQTEIKALRSELARQNTSVLGALGREYTMEKAIHDASHIKTLEDQVIRLEADCMHYRTIVESAYKQLLEVQSRDVLSTSQNHRLKDWLDLLEEFKNTVPHTLNKEQWESQTITDLQCELKKCRGDLRSDEEIFAEKNKTLDLLKMQIEEMEQDALMSKRQLEESEYQRVLQEQQLLQQQLKMDDLENLLKNQLPSMSMSFNSDHAVTSSAPPSMEIRSKSVPVQHTRKRQGSSSPLRPPSRNIHTSPALFSLDRVMQGFRARSRVLVNQLEDNDDVMQPTFNDSGPLAAPDAVFNSENEISVSANHRLLNGDEMMDTDTAEPLIRRGTFRVKKSNLPLIRNSNGSGDKESVENQNNSANVKTVRIVVSSPFQSDNEFVHPAPSSNSLNVNKLRNSTELHKRKVKDAQLRVLESNQKMRDLAINIKLKEELIKELVKTGKGAEQMNKQYEDKINRLQQEKNAVKQELIDTQKALQEVEVKEQQEEAEKHRLQQEYRKKIETAKTKMFNLQKKQKETEKAANFVSQNNKRIHDLELNVDRMKQQHERVQRRLKEETDSKSKIEHEMIKEQQRVKELELKTEQQQKILKRKNEEIAAAQRKLRGGLSLPPINGEEGDKLDQQKRLLDSEIEKVIQQRRQMEELQEELNRREDIVTKKEAMLFEKSELEMKKLRSSQKISKDMTDLLTVSTKLDSVEKRLEEKSKELAVAPAAKKEQVKEEIKTIHQAREKLVKQRNALDAKLQEGNILSTQDERRLIGLEEAIETLDAAIDYKNEAIQSRQQALRQSQILAQNEDNMLNKLNLFSSTEARSLLSRYFDKVINLRESERKWSIHCSELEMRGEEQDRLVRELENALQRTAMETDRKLTQQQREYEQKIQLLMRQLTEASNGSDTSVEAFRIKQLEKDLYYYKKTSREMKRKLRELISSGTITAPEDMDVRCSLQSLPEDAHDAGPAHSRRGARENIFDPTKASADPHPPPIRPLSGKALTPRESKAVKVFTSHDSLSSSKVTPVKLSRRDIRLLSEDEVSFRRSNVTQSLMSSQLQDSLEAGDD